MKDNKRVTILVIIALILAVTAIALNTSDSEQVPTSSPNIQSPTGAVVGIDIQPSEVEDKLAGEPAE